MSSHVVRMRHLNRLWTKGFLPTVQEVYTAIGKKQDKQAIAVKTIRAEDWQVVDGETVYSFEDDYPFAQYDLTVEPDGENVTDAQMKAWLLAKPVGSPTHNRLILRGTTPEIGIPVMVKVVKK